MTENALNYKSVFIRKKLTFNKGDKSEKILFAVYDVFRAVSDRLWTGFLKEND